jgi:hypothetical protein
MGYVFLSYAREEKSVAAALAAALNARGCDVWFDARIEPGIYWDEKIERALRSSDCVVVLWSKASVASHWVRTEAEEGRTRNILIPATIDETEPPLGFRRLQTVNLSGWSADTTHEGFEQLLGGIHRVLGQSSSPESAQLKPGPNSSRRTWLWPFTPLLAAGVLATVLRAPETAIDLDVKTTGCSFSLEQDREISDALPVEQVSITGFDLLLARTAPELENLASDAQRRILRIAPSHAGDREAITVAPIALRKGARVIIQRLEQPFAFRIALQAKPAAVTINLQHGLLFRGANGSQESLRFSSPRAITMQSADRLLTLDEQLFAEPVELLPEPLPLSQVSLSSVEERDAAQRTSVRIVSNVVGGSVVSGTARYELSESENLLIDGLEGEMLHLRLDRDYLTFGFRGQAERIRACRRDHCLNLSESYLSWLWTNHQLASFVGMALYGALILLLNLRKGRSGQAA